jgi:hypothetical protein
VRKLYTQFHLQNVSSLLFIVLVVCCKCAFTISQIQSCEASCTYVKGEGLVPTLMCPVSETEGSYQSHHNIYNESL